MFNIIKKFFLFILPILKTAVAQAAADELAKVAYPSTSRRRYTSYNRLAPMSTYPRPRTMEEQDALEAERIARVRASRDAQRDAAKSEDGFHDVLMVAFDLTGSSAAQVHEWLHNHMPAPNDCDENVHLDSWWVANDERFDRSDCDSAVFVSKGNQTEARKLLREHGLLR